MSKGKTDISNLRDKKYEKTKDGNLKGEKAVQANSYLFRMAYAPSINESTNIFQMIPALFFTAIVIMITRMASYERSMDQFFWSGGSSQLTDFFSYYKMVGILVCVALAFILLLYRVFTQSFYIKRSNFYIPMIVYTAFVLLSQLSSDYKGIALLGWNDRFEGTLTLVAYMVMLFFIINVVNSEANVRQLVYTLAGSSILLSLLGLTQAFNHDFFRTSIGKKFITPSWFWDRVDTLNFTFKNREVYQTVYNINYVSFYLTLLIPLFGLLFIRSFMRGKEEVLWKKITLGALFTLLVYNLIGSSSSGGFLGMGIVILIAIIILNKRIVQWRKPVAILLLLTIIVAGMSYDRWIPELNQAVRGVLGMPQQSTADESRKSSANLGNTSDIGTKSFKIDYIETENDLIRFSIDGEVIEFLTNYKNPLEVYPYDSSGNLLPLAPTETSPVYKVEDDRFEQFTLYPAKDEAGNRLFVIQTDGDDWPFMLTPDGPRYITSYGKTVSLHKIPAIGWENNQAFGSGRGYIWSRTIPMMQETLFIGHGADTYCIYFPQEDYAGKYNAGWNINTIVDKPHNMFMGMVIGTGGISLLAFLSLLLGYIIQSIRIYSKRLDYDFIAFCGVGIFLGIFGFIVSGLVNDSSVSVMPMFYGLLGTGISINMMIKNTNGSHPE
ncbi:hypothetical protein FRZ06_17795 [Anoxybacterium hadale]|uniref:Uncharacterized protein n=1 Tax=Anoxybacterium hadale TaxID=3408580 RepID=A0ACD1AF52_9FIRM|nr:hypothetical protein FRZ06_17795 [Clostridiales bacterium]